MLPPMRKITCGENDVEENIKDIMLEPSSKAGLEDMFTDTVSSCWIAYFGKGVVLSAVGWLF